MTLMRDPEGHEPRHLLELANLARARVLEIGCGDGRLTWRYAATAKQVFALDTDGASLALAIASRPDSLRSTVTFTQSDSQNLPFPPGSFDTAILAWAL
jgi:ubiquinone/menaquinone biosynthesis C-methylase UbiE